MYISYIHTSIHTYKTFIKERREEKREGGKLKRLLSEFNPPSPFPSLPLNYNSISIVIIITSISHSNLITYIYKTFIKERREGKRETKQWLSEFNCFWGRKKNKIKINKVLDSETER